MRTRALLVAVSIVAAGCSVSGEFSVGTPPPEDRVEEFIESEIADTVGLGDLDANCTKPASEDVGTRFLCTAVTQDGRTIELQAELEEDGAYAETTNVIVADAVEAIEQTLVAELENASGTDLADDAVDCGGESIIVDDDNGFTCELTVPEGDVFGLDVKLSDLQSDNPSIAYEVVELAGGSS